MTLSNLVLAIAILLNLLYVGMAFAAFGHVKNEKRDVRGVNRLLTLTVWWPFYDDLYDEGFARTSLMGKLLLPLVLGSYALYFFGSSILDI